MTRAVELGPHLPQILLRAANFDFRVGATEEALGYTARVLALVPDYDAAVFGLYKRLDVGEDAVLKRGLPPGRRAAEAYFRYTLSLGTLEEAALVWDWMGRHSLNDDAPANDYAALLIRTGRYEDAEKTWAAQMGPREEGYLKSNWLCNGDFSRPLSGAIFDWRVAPAPGVEVAREVSGPAPAARSLRIDFSGTENLAYGNVEQTAYLRQGSYRFSARMRTAALTTDEGIGFRVFDRDNPALVDVRTRQLRGTAPWTNVEARFQAPPGITPITVQVFRRQSGDFDNKIKGTAWIGQVTLERVGARPE